MAQSPLLGGDRSARRPPGTTTDALGPSDTSDSGSDVVGADADLGDGGFDADSDAGGTGERAMAGRDTGRRDAPDIEPDQVETLAGEETPAGEDALEDARDLEDIEDLVVDAPEDEDVEGEQP